jgi:hypothetical protein
MIAVFGIFWEFGVGWAAMSFGVVEAAYFLLIADVDEESK